MKSIEGVDITKRQLETLMYQFAAYYAGQVDLAASEIYTQAEDPQIRRRTIEWNTICARPSWRRSPQREPLCSPTSRANEARCSSKLQWSAMRFCWS